MIVIELGRLSLCLRPRSRVGAVLIAERPGRRQRWLPPSCASDRTSGVGGMREARVTNFHPHALHGQPSASAAIWVSAVQLPVPISAAAIWTM
jgi:hypothetical protein